MFHNIIAGIYSPILILIYWQKTDGHFMHEIFK